MFCGEGVLFMALGVPQALDRVPPNATYGFRTARTLGDPVVWYAVNRSTGQDMIIAGVVIALAACCCLARCATVRRQPSPWPTWR